MAMQDDRSGSRSSRDRSKVTPDSDSMQDEHRSDRDQEKMRGGGSPEPSRSTETSRPPKRIPLPD